MTLKEEIEGAINRTSSENRSNTPDFILSEYLIGCLRAFEAATVERDRWYGVNLEPANKYFIDGEPIESEGDK
jgi:hypothetical protein